MAKVKPFKAIIYNQEEIKQLKDVVCPPYDVISPEKQKYLHELSKFNLIHILFGLDVAGDDKYLRAQRYYKDWQAKGVFVRDTQPAIYFYSQQYNVRGEKKTRVGFIARLGLEQDKSVHGHEHTRQAPKEDRAKLIRHVNANLSPIFAAFSDRNRIIQRTWDKLQNKEPFIEVSDEDNTMHRLWRVVDQETLLWIEQNMQNESVFIADGHHRYEVACGYKEEMKQKLGRTTGEEPFNFVLSYFTDVNSRDLTILPIHRLLKLDAPLDLDAFAGKLKEYFHVEEIKDKVRFFFLMEKAGRSEHAIGVYKDKRYWLLRLKNIKILDAIIKDKPPEYRSLDVSILNYMVLQGALGVDLADKGHLNFSSETEELIKRVDEDPSYIAFFLNPVKIQQIMAIALNGEKMPAKSTYFYPKVLSGLVINPLTE